MIYVKISTKLRELSGRIEKYLCKKSNITTTYTIYLHIYININTYKHT